MQNQTQTRPQSLKKEVELLRNMGLEDFEVDFIVFLRTKEEASRKWN
jgi:hypothetical protein